MNEQSLAIVEELLNQLIKKFKLNNSPRDTIRIRATEDAKGAIRRVMLMAAVHGDLRSIKPLFDGKKGFGWEVVDGLGERRKVFRDGVLKN